MTKKQKTVVAVNNRVKGTRKTALNPNLNLISNQIPATTISPNTIKNTSCTTLNKELSDKAKRKVRGEKKIKKIKITREKININNISLSNLTNSLSDVYKSKFGAATQISGKYPIPFFNSHFL